MLKWGLVYAASVATFAVGAVAVVQTYSLREARRESAGVQDILDQTEKARRSSAGEAEAAKRQLREAGIRLGEERALRANLEHKLKSATDALVKADDVRQSALKALDDGAAALKREREQREVAEQALVKAIEELARDKAEVAKDKAEVARLAAEVAQLKAAPPTAKQGTASPALSPNPGLTTGSTGATKSSTAAATPATAAATATPVKAKTQVPKVASPSALAATSGAPTVPKKPPQAESGGGWFGN